MTFVKLTAIAAFTAIPVVAAFANTDSQGLPQQVELSVEERGHAIAELSQDERKHVIAELSQDERKHVIAELSVEERTHVIAGYDPEKRKSQIG